MLGMLTICVVRVVVNIFILGSGVQCARLGAQCARVKEQCACDLATCQVCGKCG